MTVTARPVVVGVDGSASALKAVRLGADEAVRRRRGLHLVHSFVWPLEYLAMGVPNPEPPEGDLRREAERILAEAASIAAEARPGVQVTTELMAGAPAAALLHKARDAELLVIGDRGLGGFTGLLVGSVAVQISAHSSTPVLVAKGEEHPGGQVVLGVDGSPRSAPAVEIAFLEAVLRDADLCAVHTWTGTTATGPDDMLPLAYEPGEAAAEEKRVLAEALAGFRGSFPDVTVQESLIRGRPAPSLLQLSETALLVVVGARGRGGFTGLLLGSVSQQVLHHSSCPVLIVPRAGH